MSAEFTPVVAVDARGHGGVEAGTVMLALGDSIAAGIGAAHVSEGCMALLRAALAEARGADLRLVNLAVPGESSASMLVRGGQLERAEALLAEMAGAGTAVGPVCVSIGGNDAMVGGEAVDRLRLNLDEMLHRLDTALRPLGAGAVSTVVLQTVYNPFEAVDDGPAAVVADAMAPRRSRGGGHNQAIRLAAERAGVRVAEVSRAFRGRTVELTWVGSGDIHPSARGHEVIAEAYLAVLDGGLRNGDRVG